MKRDKVVVYQFKKDKSIRRFQVGVRIVPVIDMKYVLVDGVSLELRPEYILLSEEGEDFIPSVLLDGDYNIIKPERLIPTTFP